MPDTACARIGRRLFNEGLVAGNFGNASIREGEGFFITRKGVYLDTPGDLVFVLPGKDVPPNASSEYRVHARTYQLTSHTAILHAHPPFSIAASFIHDCIRPDVSEGKLLCPEVHVVEGDPGTATLAERVAAALASAPVVIARGHGTFAGGRSLEEAYLLTSVVEHACRVLYYTHGFRQNLMK
jgi:L-fuculose-phosphate aldolase